MACFLLCHHQQGQAFHSITAMASQFAAGMDHVQLSSRYHTPTSALFNQTIPAVQPV